MSLDNLSSKYFGVFANKVNTRNITVFTILHTAKLICIKNKSLAVAQFLYYIL